MALKTESQPDTVRTRRQVLSPGHNPPKFVDEVLPTFEQEIHGIGGPGRTFPRAAGTHPWIAGSLTIGSNKVFNVTHIHLESSTPNVWFLLRHNHSGTAAIPGGTIQAFRMQSAGFRDIVGRADSPIRSIRGPGTVYVYGFGRRNALTGSTPYAALGTNLAHSHAATVRGYVV